MKTLAALAVMGLIVYSIWPDLEKNYVDIRTLPEFNWRNDPRWIEASRPKPRPTAPLKKVVPTQGAPHSQTSVPGCTQAAVKGPTSGDPVALKKCVARKYDVPGGALHGVHGKESGLAVEPWKDGPGWYLAADLVKPGGRCIREYGEAKCMKHWRALKTICAQTRADGAKVCDPYQVRTSYALAMGQMQHMPGEIVKFKDDGTPYWSDRAVDFDRDGVVDPHDLDDAVAMSAAFLSKYYGEYGNWQRAINRYYGSQTAGYMEGTTAGRKGVVDYWQDWCRKHERCGSDRSALAMAD
jgi:hypothetical protein